MVLTKVLEFQSSNCFTALNLAPKKGVPLSVMPSQYGRKCTCNVTSQMIFIRGELVGLITITLDLYSIFFVFYAQPLCINNYHIKVIGEFARDSLIDCNSLFVEIIEDSVGGGVEPHLCQYIPKCQTLF